MHCISCVHWNAHQGQKIVRISEVLKGQPEKTWKELLYQKNRIVIQVKAKNMVFLVELRVFWDLGDDIFQSSFHRVEM